MVAALCEARWSRLSGLPLSRSYAMNNRFGSALGCLGTTAMYRKMASYGSVPQAVDDPGDDHSETFRLSRLYNLEIWTFLEIWV